jgi:hypothetical protein
MKLRACVWGLCFAVAGLPGTAASADPQGLDLTMQVLRKDEKVDDRLVNRIELPGGRLGARKNARGTEPPAPPTQQEYQAWVEQYREAQRDRRREAWENYRQWREQQKK